MKSNIEAGKQQTIKDNLDAYVVCLFAAIVLALFIAVVAY